MKLSNKVYDVLKYIATIGLPALTTLWLTVGSIWDLPLTEPIGATMGAITVFIGTLIGISNHQYKKDTDVKGL